MKSSAVEYGLRKAGSGGARRGSGQKRALPGDYDPLIVAGECEELLRKERMRLANEAMNKELGSVYHPDQMRHIDDLPLPLRPIFRDYYERRLSAEAAQELGAADAVVEALEAVEINSQNMDGEVRGDGTRITPDGAKPIGRIFPSELPIPKGKLKVTRRRVIETVLKRYKDTHPHLTARVIEDAWRYLKRIRRELCK